MTDSLMTGLAPLPGSEAGALAEALCLCETIASRNRSNLYRVSQLLRDRRRYEAFLATYAVMRVIDDFVDAVPDVTNLAPEELLRLEGELEQWRDRIEAAASASPGPEPLDIALAAALASFPVSFSIWETFLEAMRYDLRHNRFETWENFLEYAEGAAAAPTATFLFLLCAQPEKGESAGNVRYEVAEVGDGFDYLACGRELGFFAYLVHVLRDVRKDLQTGARGRIYLPASELAKAGLPEEEFRRLVSSGTVDGRWSNLVVSVVNRARAFERAGVARTRARLPAMEPDCRLILERIVGVYHDLLDKIEADPGCVLRPKAAAE